MAENYDLIIIGGGPGGIASAVEASIFKMGKILLIEKAENHSQTIRQYYKESKRVDKDWKGQKVELAGSVDFFDGSKESTLDYFEKLLDGDLIDSVFNCEVDRAVWNGDMFDVITPNETYKGKNVIVAIGRMGRPNKPDYKIPGSLRSVVNFSPYDCRGHEKILVVGGGDSAVEYACQLTTHNNVTLACRGETIMHANAINLEMIERYDQQERLRVRYSTDIKSLENEDGKVKVNYTNDFHTIYDRAIYAIGGTTPIGFFQKSNMDIDEDKQPVINENYQTSVPGLHIVGDIVYKKGGSIAMAINHAYEVMKYLTTRAG